jgi:hypothetical protein
MAVSKSNFQPLKSGLEPPLGVTTDVVSADRIMKADSYTYRAWYIYQKIEVSDCLCIYKNLGHPLMKGRSMQLRYNLVYKSPKCQKIYCKKWTKLFKLTCKEIIGIIVIYQFRLSYCPFGCWHQSHHLYLLTCALLSQKRWSPPLPLIILSVLHSGMLFSWCVGN